MGSVLPVSRIFTIFILLFVTNVVLRYEKDERIISVVRVLKSLHHTLWRVALLSMVFLTKQLIHNLKYKNDTTVTPALLKIVRRFDFSPFTACDLIVPVPLHYVKLKKRGFNQSLLLSQLFFKMLNVPIQPFALQKYAETKAQTGLDLSLRIKNIQDVFCVKNPDIIVNKKICLVDDVFTTGSTVAECSRVLLTAGASEVRVLSFARVFLE